MKNQSVIIIKVILIGILFCGCKKDWLNGKPNKVLVVPKTIADYQALMDNTRGSPGMNQNYPSNTMVGDGDYYMTDTKFNALSFLPEKSAYYWAPTDDFYGTAISTDWKNAYSRILQSNVVLDGIKDIQADINNQPAYNNVKGTALFFRSIDFYNLSQEFCKVYNSGTASSDLGLPLRISSNVNITVDRSSLQATYDRIIGDLKTSISLLPAKPLYPTRPSKAAAYGLLSRIFLSQDDYNKALLYADSCLQIQNTLMDYNQLSFTASAPITLFNKEVIFHSGLTSYTSFGTSYLIIDPSLYQSYSANDLRLNIFFTKVSGNNTTKSSYTGTNSIYFGGIATDEMYLTRAECYARTNDLTNALKDLNTLLQNRLKTGTFTNITASTSDAALQLILNERRKELCFRNLRWTDLRRLNKDPRFQVTITRTINGQTYTLAPNSPRYVLPLDPKEILTGGLQQNSR